MSHKEHKIYFYLLNKEKKIVSIDKISDIKSGYERKISMNDSKSGRTIKSCIKGIKKIDIIPGVDHDYNRSSGHYDPNRHHSSLRKRDRESEESRLESYKSGSKKAKSSLLFEDEDDEN